MRMGQIPTETTSVKFPRLKILIGIDEEYTNRKIIECFLNRNDYQVVIYDKHDLKQKLSKENLQFDIFWLEYEDLDFEQLLSSAKSNKYFNSYCIRKGLIRKAQLAFYLKKYSTKKQNSILAKCVPETYVFELDYLDYIDEALNDVFEVENSLRENEIKMKSMGEKTKKFILKSSMTNKGAEMLIFDTRSQLENYFQRRVDLSEDESLDLREWVIQEYMDKPLQLNKYQNRKFHLRVYVLAVGSIKVYVYEDILALFSLDPYDNSFKYCDTETMNLKSHITNTCYQLDDCKNVKSVEELNQMESECVKRFWSIDLSQVEHIKTENKHTFIFDQIKLCVGELFECVSNEPTVFQTIPNAFELYGLDFLVDENLNCYFLEANAFPDFKQTGENLNDLISCLFYQTIALTCDEYFKRPKVCDPNKMHLVFEKSLNKS